MIILVQNQNVAINWIYRTKDCLCAIFLFLNYRLNRYLKEVLVRCSGVMVATLLGVCPVTGTLTIYPTMLLKNCSTTLSLKLLLCFLEVVRLFNKTLQQTSEAFTEQLDFN